LILGRGLAVARWARAALAEMQERVIQMGLRECPVCGTDALGILPLPTIVTIGATKEAMEKGDKNGNVLFLLHIECETCGHVLLFNSERLKSEPAMWVGDEPEPE
jgi:hypothetical protein